MRKLRPTRAPNLPLASVNYNRDQDEQFKKTLRLYFDTIDQFTGNLTNNNGGANVVSPFGAFHDSTTQTAAVINTPYGIRAGVTDASNGVYTDTVDRSKIYVTESAFYNIQFSIQLHKTNASTGYIWIWYRINGVDVANSATKVAILGTNAETVAAWNFVTELTGGQYIQIMWATNDVNCQILAEPATAFCPAIPSAIISVTVVSAPIE